ncbi:MAG: hypothetical protein Q9222_004749 [Ikaeria aurantiellina]
MPLERYSLMDQAFAAFLGTTFANLVFRKYQTPVDTGNEPQLPDIADPQISSNSAQALPLRNDTTAKSHPRVSSEHFQISPSQESVKSRVTFVYNIERSSPQSINKIFEGLETLRLRVGKLRTQIEIRIGSSKIDDYRKELLYALSNRISTLGKSALSAFDTLITRQRYTDYSLHPALTAACEEVGSEEPEDLPFHIFGCQTVESCDCASKLQTRHRVALEMLDSIDREVELVREVITKLGLLSESIVTIQEEIIEKLQFDDEEDPMETLGFFVDDVETLREKLQKFDESRGKEKEKVLPMLTLTSGGR